MGEWGVTPAASRIEAQPRILYIDRLPIGAGSRLSVPGTSCGSSCVDCLSIGATEVTIDKSLKVRRGALKNRNVLTRVERIAKLTETDRWTEGDPILGLPKVRVQKISLKKKKKSKKDEEEDKK